jgi:hypothetical protein
MNKYFICIAFLFATGCTTSYKVFNKGAHVIVDPHGGSRYYENETLNLSVKLLNDNDATTDNAVYAVDSLVTDQEVKRLLRFSGFDERKDTVLYVDPRKKSIIVLKDISVDLSAFMEYELGNDTVIFNCPRIKDYEHKIYRKTTIDTKKNFVVFNDIIPFRGKYVQQLYQMWALS